MNCLLDTHTFLWAAMRPEQLSRHARVAILDTANDIHVSVVTFWEVSLKFAARDGSAVIPLPQTSFPSCARAGNTMRSYTSASDTVQEILGRCRRAPRPSRVSNSHRVCSCVAGDPFGVRW